ncbi:MAG: hypothetical protein ACE5G2_13740, partial [Candidatus Krumholzibacteriia bacterium]
MRYRQAFLCVGSFLALPLAAGVASCSRSTPEERAQVKKLMEHRALRDDYMSSSEGPLLPEQRGRFKGLAYYKPNFDMIFEVDMEPVAAPDTVRFVTSRNTYDSYVRLGVLRFEQDGR